MSILPPLLCLHSAFMLNSDLPMDRNLFTGRLQREVGPVEVLKFSAVQIRQVALNGSPHTAALPDAHASIIEDLLFHQGRSTRVQSCPSVPETMQAHAGRALERTALPGKAQAHKGLQNVQGHARIAFKSSVRALIKTAGSSVLALLAIMCGIVGELNASLPQIVLIPSHYVSGFSIDGPRAHCRASTNVSACSAIRTDESADTMECRYFTKTVSLKSTEAQGNALAKTLFSEIAPTLDSPWGPDVIIASSEPKLSLSAYLVTSRDPGNDERCLHQPSF